MRNYRLLCVNFPLFCLLILLCNLDTKALTSSRESSLAEITSTTTSATSFSTPKKEELSPSTTPKFASGFSQTNQGSLRTTEQPKEDIKDLNTSSSASRLSFLEDKKESQSNPVQSLLRDLLHGTKVGRKARVTSLVSQASLPSQELQTNFSWAENANNRSSQNEYLTRKELEDQYLTSAIDLLEKLVADEVPDERKAERNFERRTRREKSQERRPEDSQSTYKKNKVTDKTSKDETWKQENKSSIPSVTPSMSSLQVSSTTTSPTTSTIKSSIITSPSHSLGNVTTSLYSPSSTSGHETDILPLLKNHSSTSRESSPSTSTETYVFKDFLVVSSHVSPSAPLVSVDEGKLQTTTEKTVVTQNALHVERHDDVKKEEKHDERKVRQEDKYKEQSQEREVEQLTRQPTLKKEEKSATSSLKSEDSDKKEHSDQKEHSDKKEEKEKKQVILQQKLNADQTQTRDQWSRRDQENEKKQREEDGEDRTRIDMKSQRLTQRGLEDARKEDTRLLATTKAILVRSQSEHNSREKKYDKNAVKKKVSEEQTRETSTAAALLPDLGSPRLESSSNLNAVDQELTTAGFTRRQEVLSSAESREVTPSPSLVQHKLSREDELKSFRDRKDKIEDRGELETTTTSSVNIHESSSIHSAEENSSIINKDVVGEEDQEEEEEVEARIREDSERRLHFSLDSHSDHQSSSPQTFFHYNRLTVYISSGISVIFLLVTFFSEMLHCFRFRNHHPVSLSSLFSTSYLRSSSCYLLKCKTTSTQDSISKSEQEQDCTQHVNKKKKKNICPKHKYFSNRSFILVNFLLVLTAIQLLFLFGFPFKQSEKMSLSLPATLLRPVEHHQILSSWSSRLTELQSCYCYAFLLHFLHLLAAFCMFSHSVFLSWYPLSTESKKNPFLSRWQFRNLFLFSWLMPLAIIALSHHLNPTGYEIKR